MNSEWKYRLIKSAEKDFSKLDKSQQIRVLKGIRKVVTNPLPRNEGGYGEPLENQNDNKLAGCCKIKIKSEGLRIVYRLVRIKSEMQIIIISVRDDRYVYKEAEKRLKDILAKH